MPKLDIQTADFHKALANFRKVLNEPKSEIVRDSAIKRFELLFDLAWKTLKEYLEVHFGVVVNSPILCFREAFRQNLIEHDETWIQLVKTRNYTVHAYNEQLAEKVFSEFPRYLPYFEKLAKVFKTTTTATTENQTAS